LKNKANSKSVRYLYTSFLILLERKIKIRENTKIILEILIAIILSITGSVMANTVLSADSVSYKTSNGGK
jgi:hypothetical protein